MRGKQVSPPAPFRRAVFGRRWEVKTQTAGVNPASPVTPGILSLPLSGRVLDAGETGFPPSPLPQSSVWEALGSENSDGRSESGLSSDAWDLVPPPFGEGTRCGGNRFPPQPPSAEQCLGGAGK